MTFDEFLLIYDKHDNYYIESFITDSELISSNISKNDFQDKEAKYFIYNGLINSNISSKNIQDDLQLIKKYYSDDLKSIFFTEKRPFDEEIVRIIKILDYFMCKRLNDVVILFDAKYGIFNFRNISDDLNIKIEHIDLECNFLYGLRETLVSNINYYRKYYSNIFNLVNYPLINNYTECFNYITQMINIKVKNNMSENYEAKIYNDRKIIIPRNLPCNYFCKY